MVFISTCDEIICHEVKIAKNAAAAQAIQEVEIALPSTAFIPLHVLQSFLKSTTNLRSLTLTLPSQVGIACCSSPQMISEPIYTGGYFGPPKNCPSAAAKLRN